MLHTGPVQSMGIQILCCRLHRHDLGLGPATIGTFVKQLDRFTTITYTLRLQSAMSAYLSRPGSRR